MRREKKPPWILAPRLPVAAERNNFRDIHRRAGQQLLSLTGRVRGGGGSEGSAIISRLFEFEKLAKRPDGARGSLIGGGRENKVRIPPVCVLACSRKRRAHRSTLYYILCTRVSYVRRIDVIDSTRTLSLSAKRYVIVLRTPK